MTSQDAVAEMFLLLEEERGALRMGNLAALSDLTLRKQSCLEALQAQAPSQDALERLRKMQHRNDTLLQAALGGLNMVRALTRTGRTALSVYQPDGKAKPLDTPQQRLTQRL